MSGKYSTTPVETRKPRTLRQRQGMQEVIRKGYTETSRQTLDKTNYSQSAGQ